MDLLGSIMKGMERRPQPSQAELKRMQEHKKALAAMKSAERKQLDAFKAKFQKIVSDFSVNKRDRIESESGEMCERCVPCQSMPPSCHLRKCLPPMDKVQRTIVHDFAEQAGVSSHSFGIEGENKHVMLVNKDCSLGDEELDCLKRALNWKDVQVEKQRRLDTSAESQSSRKRKPDERLPSSSLYSAKYLHLLDSNTAEKEAQPNRQYGMVSSELKKDTRSVEQTLADMRKRKQMAATETTE